MKLKIITAAVVLTATLSTNSVASIQFSDRAAFESALDTYFVDNLDGIVLGNHGVDVRSGYRITSSIMRGVIHQTGIGDDNSSIGFDDAYMFTYNQSGPVIFHFDSPQIAFGLDYGVSQRLYQGLPMQIRFNNIVDTSPSQPGFFGVIFDEPTQRVEMHALNTGQIRWGLFDNVTIGSSLATSTVPEPPSWLTLAGLGVCLGGIGWWRQQLPKA